MAKMKNMGLTAEVYGESIGEKQPMLTPSKWLTPLD
jgi:hypothetical protein